MFIAPGADDNAMMSRLSRLLRVKMGYARQGTGWVATMSEQHRASGDVSVSAESRLEHAKSHHNLRLQAVLVLLSTDPS